MRCTLLLAAALIGLGSPLTASAQSADAPRQDAGRPPQAGQTDAGGDPSNSDSMGATGWTGSWTANEGTQQDDAGTATTNQTKPMPPVPPAESPPK